MTVNDGQEAGGIQPLPPEIRRAIPPAMRNAATFEYTGDKIQKRRRATTVTRQRTIEANGIDRRARLAFGPISARAQPHPFGVSAATSRVSNRAAPDARSKRGATSGSVPQAAALCEKVIRRIAARADAPQKYPETITIAWAT